MDRFLVRVLIAVELYAFGDEMFNEMTFGLFPARSPLKQRHALLQYLRGQLVNGVLFGGIAALALWASSSGLLGLSTAEWIMGGSGFLFLAFASVSTFALPFWWYAQAMARRRIRKLLATMSTLYNEQKSDGPISAQYVRDRAEDASKQGVVGCANSFLFFSGICLPGLKLQLCVIRVRKRLENRKPHNSIILVHKDPARCREIATKVGFGSEAAPIPKIGVIEHDILPPAIECPLRDHKRPLAKPRSRAPVQRTSHEPAGRPVALDWTPSNAAIWPDV